jgi:hypothetical protein
MHERLKRETRNNKIDIENLSPSFMWCTHHTWVKKHNEKCQHRWHSLTHSCSSQVALKSKIQMQILQFACRALDLYSTWIFCQCIFQTKQFMISLVVLRCYTRVQTATLLFFSLFFSLFLLFFLILFIYLFISHWGQRDKKRRAIILSFKKKRGFRWVKQPYLLGWL